MKRKHYLLELFNGVEDCYVLEAIERREAVRPQIRKGRIFLIAAALALALLLVGCVAVFLGLQQRTIGEIPVTQKFDAYGMPVSEPEKTWFIATMSGYGSSPAQQASQEWSDFVRTYRPENLTNETDLPAIPNQYEYTYHCLDQTMVDRLDGIAEHYSLALLGERAVAQVWQRQTAFEILGLDHLVLGNAPAKAELGACQIYPPYNFVCDVRLTLTGEDASWTEEAYCEVYYLQAGYLAPNDTFLYDPQTTQEWEYTSRDGTKLLLALSGPDGIILAQREDSTIVIQMDLAWQQGVFLEEGSPLPTRKAVEQLADCFDFTVQTQAAPMKGLQEQLDAIPDPNDLFIEDYEEPRYRSFAEYLNEHCLWPEMVEYALYDIDGDGEKDLITSYGDGIAIHWLTIRDGQVMDLTGGRSPLRLCEGGIAEHKDPAMELHVYMKILGPHPETGTEMESVCTVSFGSGQWKIDGNACTEQEAAQRIAQYPPLELDWQPLLSFPTDDRGGTFADVIAQEESLTQQQLLAFYAEHYHSDWDYSSFELRDINDDGIPDLLLSHDGELVDVAYTYRRGRFIGLGGGFRLCTDNVTHSLDRIERYNEGILERHHFTKQIGGHTVLYYQLTHNLSTGVWKDTNYTEISETDGREILEKHSHVEMHMRPISELTKH